MTSYQNENSVTADVIADFLVEKSSISKATKQAYLYDLEQFIELVEGRINDTSLLYYQEFLKSLKISAQKRKQSTINQFLYYLYDMDKIDKYYRLKKVQTDVANESPISKLDLDFLTKESSNKDGRLIASLIVFMGLTLKEISDITGDMIDYNFKVLRVIRNGHVRILQIPDIVFQQLPQRNNATYLFDNKGKAYSRQWFFLQLKDYLESFNLSHVTAQDLRHQFIVSQIALGKSISEIAKQLGLKSTQTLEKFFK